MFAVTSTSPLITLTFSFWGYTRLLWRTNALQHLHSLHPFNPLHPLHPSRSQHRLYCSLRLDALRLLPDDLCNFTALGIVWQGLVVLIIDLVVVHPVTPVLQLPVFKKFSIAVPEVVFEISTVNEFLSVVNVPKAALFVIVVLASILYSSFSLSEVALPVA